MAGLIRLPSREALLEMFSYCPDSGELRWRNPPVGRGHRAIPGSVVGTNNGKGYLVVKMEKKAILLHRIIFKILWDQEPSVIDHADRNRLNNRADNLRQCTHQQNLCNRRKHGQHEGIKGVYKRRICGQVCYAALIVKDGKRYDLGVYGNPVDAAQAYNHEALRLFGEFACLNNLEEVRAFPRQQIPQRRDRRSALEGSPVLLPAYSQDSYF